jgi:hypothetical protein
VPDPFVRQHRSPRGPVFRGIQVYGCDRRERAMLPTAVIERSAPTGRGRTSAASLRGNTGRILHRPVP